MEREYTSSKRPWMLYIQYILYGSFTVSLVLGTIGLGLLGIISLATVSGIGIAMFFAYGIIFSLSLVLSFYVGKHVVSRLEAHRL